MPDSEAPLPETVECACPVCRSEQMTPMGHVIAGGGWIKVEHRCEACGVAFLVVRRPLV